MTKQEMQAQVARENEAMAQALASFGLGENDALNAEQEAAVTAAYESFLAAATPVQPVAEPTADARVELAVAEGVSPEIAAAIVAEKPKRKAGTQSDAATAAAGRSRESYLAAIEAAKAIPAPAALLDAGMDIEVGKTVVCTYDASDTGTVAAGPNVKGRFLVQWSVWPVSRWFSPNSLRVVQK